MEGIAEKKKEKRSKLFNAAYELFASKGINNTVIDDIVKKAGVAKGTFYLYFKDKYDLVDKMILQKSTTLIKEAIRAVKQKQAEESLNFEDSVISFIDYLLEYFSKNIDLLTVIRKNLSLGLNFTLNQDGEVQEVVRDFTDNLIRRGSTLEQAQQTLYIIIEMVGSVCCDAIVSKEPYALEEIKPTLYLLVRKLLK